MGNDSAKHIRLATLASQLMRKIQTNRSEHAQRAVAWRMFNSIAIYRFNWSVYLSSLYALIGGALQRWLINIIEWSVERGNRIRHLFRFRKCNKQKQRNIANEPHHFDRIGLCGRRAIKMLSSDGAARMWNRFLCGMHKCRKFLT